MSLIFRKENLSASAILLQQLASVKSEKDFLKRCPSGLELTFTFVKQNEEIVKEIYSLLQSLSCDIGPGKRQKKQNRLTELLDSKHEFSTVKSFLTSSLPITAEKISAPAAPEQHFQKKQKLKTQKPSSQKKKISDKIIHNKNYAPEVDLKNAYKILKGITDFSIQSSCLRIYIDETWPGTQSSEYKDVGVICGLVWDGKEIDESMLPHCKTHLRDKSKKHLRKALHNVYTCPKVFPFIFPIFKEDVKVSDYTELLKISLLSLLGWILPQNGKQCDVKIFCEGIGSSGLMTGCNIFESFNEMIKTLCLTQNRCHRWNITEFISTTVENKEFEYIPYADVLGYTVVPTIKSKEYCGEKIIVESLPGYVPLSKTLLQELCSLDTGSPAGYADALMNFAKGRIHTKLFAYVMQQTVARMKENADFNNALFAKIETMFEEKERDLRLLNTICEILCKEFTVNSFENYPRQKLLRILIEMQNANHSGNPEKIKECVALYNKNYKILFGQDLNLCAYADMNLAVHFNDRFEFAQAAEICRKWEKNPAYEFLTPENKGRILSSIGQTYAFAKDFINAEEYFTKACDIFTNKQNHISHEQYDHTLVYRALNILDCKAFPVAKTVAEMVFKCSFDEAIDRYASTIEMPFHHHLLVRNLYMNPDLSYLKEKYLSKQKSWVNVPQHPWELIELYRSLMICINDSQKARKRFALLWELYSEINGGSTLHLLEAYALTASKKICGCEVQEEEFNNLLKRIKQNLPAASDICNELQKTFAAPGRTMCWDILPFNYK